MGKKTFGGRSAGILHRIAFKTAFRLNKQSGEMERRVARLARITELLIESNVGYLNLFAPETEEQMSQLLNGRASLVILLEATRETLSSVEAFARL